MKHFLRIAALLALFAFPAGAEAGCIIGGDVICGSSTPASMVTPILALGSSTTGPSNSAASYGPLIGGSGSPTSSTINNNVYGSVIPVAGAISKLSVVLPATVASGSWSVALTVNGTTASALTCTISSGTTCTDPTNSVTVAAGDIVSWKFTPTGTPTAQTVVQIGAIFTSASPNESFLTAQGNMSNSVTNYVGFGGNTNTPTATEANLSSVVAAAGVIDRLYVAPFSSPGSGPTYVATVYLNGSPTSITCTISSAAQCSDLTHSISVVAGDLISLQSVPNSTPTATLLKAAVRWVPTVTGQAMVMMSASGSVSNTATRYLNMSGFSAIILSTETDSYSVASTSFTIKNLITSQVTAPGIGQTRTINLRKGSAAAGTPGNISCTVATAATSCTDTTNTYTTSASDLLDWQTTVSGTNAVTTGFKIGAVVTVP